MLNKYEIKKLTLRIGALFRIMNLEGKLVDKSLIHKEWEEVTYWNERKKATAKALRKFVALNNGVK
jgi:hypothetical protein